MWWVASLLLLSNLSFSFDHFIMMCLGVDLFKIFLLGVYLSSWMCRLMFFIKFWTFSTIISSNILSAPFFLSSHSETLILHVLVHLMVSCKLLRLCSFWKFFFLPISQTECISTDLMSGVLILSSACLNLLLSPLVTFALFKFRISIWFFFNNSYPFIDILCLENILLFSFYFLFFGCTQVMWKFLAQRSDWHHSIDPSHIKDNAGSLTYFAMRELLL